MIWTNCVPPCNAELLDPSFYEKLEQIEKQCKMSSEHFQLRINSAYRPYEWEIRHHRQGTSSHCKGLAVDIHVDNNRQRCLLVAFALALGIDRIGQYRSFVHLDMDKSKFHPCMFFGDVTNLLDYEY